MVRCHDKQQTWGLLVEHVRRSQANMIDFARSTFHNITNGLMYEDIKSLKQAGHAIEEQKSTWKRYRFSFS